MNAKLEELRELLEEYETGLLITRDDDDNLHSRPMAVVDHEGAGCLWFATQVDSAKVHELEEDPRCGVAFHSSERSATYVSLSGHAVLVRDPEVLRSKWTPSLSAWFPQGPEGDDVMMIRFVIDHAEWMHPRGGRLTVLKSMARRILTGSMDEPAAKEVVDLVVH